MPHVPYRPTPLCEQPAKTGMCLAYIPQFFYNMTSGQCEQFIYGKP